MTIGPLILASLWCTVSAAPQMIVPGPTWDTLPAEVSGSARGLHALHVDPAGAGDFRGAALQLRHVGTPEGSGSGALGLGAGLAVGPATFVAGYTWANLPDPKGGRGLLGVSLALNRRLRLGLNLRRVRPTFSPQVRSVVDAGLTLVPHRTLTLSVGVDALNAPAWPRRAHMRRALRVGVGLRPLGGHPWLTLGIDTRMAYAAGAHFDDTRAALDVSPYEGVHLVAAYHRRPLEQLVWAGVSLDAFGVEVLGAGRVHGAERASSASRMAWALTLHSHDADALPIDVKRHVHVDVSENLKSQAAVPWAAQEAVALLPARLARLAELSDVAEVTLHIGSLDVGYGVVDELRDAVAALRGHRIVVHAHLQVADTKSYLLAAAADRITMDPVGTLDVRGVALQHHYLADTLALAGVRMEAVAVGQYKSAPAQYTASGPSPQEEQVSGRIAQQLYSHILGVLTHDRALSCERAHAALASGPLGAVRAQKLGLIDGIEPQAGAEAKPFDRRPKLRATGLTEPTPEPTWGPAPRVAIVALEGMLVQGGANSPPWGATATSEHVVRALYRAGHDRDVAGIVLRIDSPGGDVLAAEEVYRAVRAVSRVKPLAVSMGDVAASGGYWAAVGAPIIFASPHTLTGSIGIYSLKPDVSGLLQKLAVHSHAVNAGERAGAGSYERPMSADERQQQQRHLDELYGLFVQRVAQGRKMSQARAQEVAQGRVYTGEDALALGLVDARGGLFDAIGWVAQQAHVDRDAALRWQVPKARPGLGGMLGQLGAANVTGAAAPAAALWAQWFVDHPQGWTAPQALAPTWLGRVGP